MATRSAGVRFFLSNGTMHHATRLSAAKMSFIGAATPRAARAVAGNAASHSRRVNMEILRSRHEEAVAFVLLIQNRPKSVATWPSGAAVKTLENQSGGQEGQMATHRNWPPVKAYRNSEHNDSSVYLVS